MNILFITLVEIKDINDRNIYADLMRCFIAHGHQVNIVSPVERRSNTATNISQNSNCSILRVKSLNIQKTNLFEKTTGIFLIDFQIKKAIKQYLDISTIDLILYSTPPITITNTIKHCKKISGAKAYLLLKDIFPQNAVDLCMMREHSLLYKYFRNKEKELYALSDKIGCMSPANVAYVEKHNPQINTDKVEENPNSIYPVENPPTAFEKLAYKRLFNLPENKRVFLYGGNLGKPQGVDFIIEFLKSQKNNQDVFIVIIGSGTEFPKIQKWFTENMPTNMRLLNYLPKDEYDNLVKSADVGMIFLDHRFTIPNFPSRLLSYIENAIPVIAATDVNTDIGTIIEKNNFGKWCSSDDVQQLNSIVDDFIRMSESELFEMGKHARTFLEKKYHINVTYRTIMELFKHT